MPLIILCDYHGQFNTPDLMMNKGVPPQGFKIDGFLLICYNATIIEVGCYHVFD